MRSSATAAAAGTAVVQTMTAFSPAFSIHPPMVSETSHAFSPMIVAAAIQESAVTQRRLANSPMIPRSLVNRISGTTANGSCKLRITWLTRSRSYDPASPFQEMTITAGMIAIRRVVRRRRTGRILNLINPSITICPASVPVKVEL